MDMLSIRNWDRWQSYRKDRGQPPWIKVHRALLRDVQWVSLTDQQRGQLVSMWMLAADRDGKIPADPDIIKKLCHMDKAPDIQTFIDKGFIDGDANVTSGRRQHDQPEKSRDRVEKRREETDMVKLTFDRWWDSYPKKVGKKDAFKSYKKARKDPEWPGDDEVLTAIRRQVDANHFRGSNNQDFVPNPATWLNQGRWCDVIDRSGRDKVSEVFGMVDNRRVEE